MEMLFLGLVLVGSMSEIVVDVNRHRDIIISSKLLNNRLILLCI